MSTPNVHQSPATRRAPRRARLGGFVLSPETAAAWAKRLCGKDYHPTNNFYSIREVIATRICQYPLKIGIFGEVWPDDVNYMVMTQMARFEDGYRGMDPSLIPQFEEGESEAIARPLLEEEGVVDYEFKTILR